MNGGLYTAEQIDKHYPGLEGTLAPLGHPMVDGSSFPRSPLKGSTSVTSALGTVT